MYILHMSLDVDDELGILEVLLLILNIDMYLDLPGVKGTKRCHGHHPPTSIIEISIDLGFRSYNH